MVVKSASDSMVTVFGGSGFLGRHVVRVLANRGYRIRVAVRRPELCGHLRPMGRVGQIHAVQANLRYPQSIAAAMRDADIAVNLVGILFERGQQRFEAVQAAGAGLVSRAPGPVGGQRGGGGEPGEDVLPVRAGRRAVLPGEPAHVVAERTAGRGPGRRRRTRPCWRSSCTAP